jgi:hypothetical protein
MLLDAARAATLGDLRCHTNGDQRLALAPTKPEIALGVLAADGSLANPVSAGR